MRLDWRDFEVLTFEQAAMELAISSADATVFANAAVEIHGDIRQSDHHPHTRAEWRRLLGAVPIWKIYAEINAARRDDLQMTNRAIEASGLAFAIREAIDAKKEIPRPKEKLGTMRSELKRRLNNPRQRTFGVPAKIRYEHTKIPEIGDALQKLTPGGPISAQHWLEAIDMAMKVRSRRGRPRHYLQAELYRRLWEDFAWLTDRVPSWTNAAGTPQGDFIDFVQSVYRTLGVGQVSEVGLRPPRRKTG